MSARAFHDPCTYLSEDRGKPLAYRRLSADELHPTDADYRPAAPGDVMDTVRRVARS